MPAVNARMVKKPLILFIDGHKTHVTMEASDACIENGIELYCLLEHSSHIIQPLDLRFFGSLKSAWRQSVRDWQAQHIGEFVTKQTFARVLKPAWDASATVDAAVKGFRDAGLFPFNSSAVDDSVKLDPSQLFSSKLSSSGNCVDLSTSNISQSIRLPAEPTIPSPPVPSTALNQPVPSTTPTLSVPPSAPTPPVLSRAPTLPALSTAPTPPVPPTDFSDVVANVTSSDPHAATVGLTEVDSQVTDRATSPKTSGNHRSNDSNTHSPFSKFLSIPKPKTDKPKAKRMIMPKAITGSTYRSLLQEKREKQAKEEQEKLERKKAREEKKLKKEEELRAKRELQAKKREEREKKKREAIEIRKNTSRGRRKNIERYRSFV